MRGNLPIPELPTGEDVWLAVVVTSIREIKPTTSRPFAIATARNSTGRIALKIPLDPVPSNDLKPGLWGVVGRLELFQNQAQLAVSELRPITADKYRELQLQDPPFPRAFTIDIETIPLPEFRTRAAQRLKRAADRGKMNSEQVQRYTDDQAAEEERSFKAGSLSAASGRVLSIAVHIGAIPGLEYHGCGITDREYLFGIDADGHEQPEREALLGFLALLRDFDPEVDEIVGHNIISFDLPFIFQRCLVNNIAVKPFVNLSDFNVRGAYDTMHRWWLGSRNRIGLDDLAWALGIDSSKSDEIEGSRVFELYEAGRLIEIREYNLNDVRVTRKVYERLVGGFGR